MDTFIENIYKDMKREDKNINLVPVGFGTYQVYKKDKDIAYLRARPSKRLEIYIHNKDIESLFKKINFFDKCKEKEIRLIKSYH